MRCATIASTRDVGVDVIAFCDEEGHFGSYLGSRSFIGDVTEAEIDKARDRTHGRMMREALQEAGYAGRPRLNFEPGRYAGYFEAHIEQGRTLETSHLKIGVVTAIVGLWDYRIKVTGHQNHAGTTTMAERKDAGMTLVRLIAAIDQKFKQISGPRSVWTCGRMEFDPGAPSIVPGEARAMFQFRDSEFGDSQSPGSGIARAGRGVQRGGTVHDRRRDDPPEHARGDG